MKAKAITKMMLGVLCLAVAIVVAMFVGLIWHLQNQDGFLEGTTCRGVSIAGLKPADALEFVVSESKDPKIVIYESNSVDKRPVIVTTMSDAGYELDCDGLFKNLQSVYDKQKSDIRYAFDAIRSGGDKVDFGYRLDMDKFDKTFSTDNMYVKRRKTVDASIEWSGKDNAYVIVEGSKGNELDQQKLYDYIVKKVSESINEMPAADVCITIPDDVYTSRDPVSKDDPGLVDECQRKNAEYQASKK